METKPFDGYCVKCKEKRNFQGTPVQAKNGTFMAKGNCPKCGTGMNRILGKNYVAK